MEFESDRWTIKPSKTDKDGVGVFLTANVNQGELLGTAHMLDPDGFVTGYYSSLGRYHNHSLENPNFRAHTEGGFTRLIALRNCDSGDEVLVDYNDYRYIPNVEIPEEFEEEEPKRETTKKEDAPPKEAAKAAKPKAKATKKPKKTKAAKPKATKKPKKTKVATKVISKKKLKAPKPKKAKSV